MSPLEMFTDNGTPKIVGIEKIIVRTHATGTVIGIIIGGLISIFGIYLMICGLSGSIDWIVNAGGLSSKLINASPGTVVVVAGMIIMIRYKPRVRYEYEIKETPTTYYEKGSGAASSPLSSYTPPPRERDQIFGRNSLYFN